MSDPDIRRVREDLETMRQAAGLSLAFDRLDVWIALALVPAGALLSAWSYFGPQDQWRFGIAPLLVPVLIASYRRAKRRDPSSRRERTFEAAAGMILAVGAVTYLLGLKVLGFSLDLAAPTVVFVLGLLSIVLGLSSPGRRVALAGAVAIPFGVAGVFLKGPAVGIAGGLFIILAAAAAAAIMAWQLRESRELHESASN
jgi:hypothetical protein